MRATGSTRVRPQLDGRPVAMVSREPCGPMSRLELVPLLTAPRCARRYARAVLDAWQLCADTLSTAESLISELMTNAIQAVERSSALTGVHGQEGAQHISLTLRLLPGRLIIEVFDNYLNPPVLADVSPDSENGRGLQLVQVLSKDWGFLYPPSGGKIVYAIVGLPDAEVNPKGLRCGSL